MKIFQKKDERKCMGIYYRCNVSFYRNKKGVFNKRVKMTPLKTYSCGGRCREYRDDNAMCDEEWLEECLNCDDEDVPMPDDPKDGGLYQLVCIVHDEEEWDWKFELQDERESQNKRDKIYISWKQGLQEAERLKMRT